MNIEELTLKQLREISSLFSDKSEKNEGLNCYIGKNVIVRTYSAGVWCGTLSQKADKEVILTNARRLWRWKTVQSISLSAVALYGIDHANSKIAPAVEGVWLEAIEIIPTTDIAAKSIAGAKDEPSR